MKFTANADKKRKVIVVFIIMAILSIMQPMLCIALAIYVIYGAKKLRVYKSVEAAKFDKAIFKFRDEKYEEALSIIQDKFEIDEIEEQALLMRAYCTYKLNRYREFLEYVNKIPKDKMEYNYTLLLAEGEALEALCDEKGAHALYSELTKKFPKSEFLKSKLKN